MTLQSPLQSPSPPMVAPKRSRLQFWLIVAVCFGPFIAAFIVWKFELGPDARTNYGDFIEPQKPVTGLNAIGLDASTPPLESLRGKWVMLHADEAACPVECATQLYSMRQVRASLNEGQRRVERVWLVLDDGPINPAVLAAHEGLRVYRVRADDWRAFLPVPGGQGRIEDHVFMIDPLGNLMMRWPANFDAKEMRKDAYKLLRASRIG